MFKTRRADVVLEEECLNQLLWIEGNAELIKTRLDKTETRRRGENMNKSTNKVFDSRPRSP